MDNYEIKWEYLTNKYGHRCPIWEEKKHINPAWHMPKFVTDLHHPLHNTKTNRKLYPLLIDSVINLIPVENGEHLNNGSWKPAHLPKVLDGEWARKWERFLEKHPKIAKWVNCPEGRLFE